MPYFGEIIDGEMVLSDHGKTARKYWQEIPAHFPNIALDQFIIMPNHVHGILIINDNFPPRRHLCCTDRRPCTDAINRVSTNDTNDTNGNSEMDRNGGQIKNGGATGYHNPMIHQNISTIIRWYKGRTSFEIKKFNPDFAWQPRFHDHIIRDENELNKIRQYIMDNPVNWKKESNHE